MKRPQLSQVEVDKLVFADRLDVEATVYNCGRNDVPFAVKISGQHLWQYALWKRMLERSFSDKWKQKYPTYKDVTVCGDWLSFANFLEWVNKEVGYNGKPEKMDLDKDIIVRGNKIYSPNTCCFVPQAVNKLLTDGAASRGEWPVGVCFNKAFGKFVATLNCCGERKHLGYHECSDDAFTAYKIAKEAHVKLVALRYRSEMSSAAFDALMAWEVVL